MDGITGIRSASFEAILVGATALALLGVASRHTKDCDVLAPEIPPQIQEMSRRFAHEQRQMGRPLDDDWLNNGPSSLSRDLPKGWKGRIRQVFGGKALTLHTLGRTDLLRSKLFALCDRGLDMLDCVALEPTHEEIESIRPWLEDRDANPEWPDHVRATLHELEERMENGV